MVYNSLKQRDYMCMKQSIIMLSCKHRLLDLLE